MVRLQIGCADKCHEYLTNCARLQPFACGLRSNNAPARDGSQVRYHKEKSIAFKEEHLKENNTQNFEQSKYETLSTSLKKSVQMVPNSVDTAEREKSQFFLDFLL